MYIKVSPFLPRPTPDTDRSHGLGGPYRSPGRYKVGRPDSRTDTPHLQHYTFYNFIVNKARGKSGPLFNFDVHDDVRLLADASKEKDESHAGKVVERSWYQRNKHIFPASRWEVRNVHCRFNGVTYARFRFTTLRRSTGSIPSRRSTLGIA